ncbi:hypothetical protein ACFLXI_03480 [Chloroflexota bacterium]
MNDRQVNMFQKAVLGLCRSGQKNEEAIASFLQLNSELVKYIFIELRRDGLLSSNREITNKGQEVLTSELDNIPSEIVPLYVFQDPWSGRLWPRVMESLEHASVEYSPGKIFPRLVFGSKGKPRTFEPFVKSGNNAGFPTTPDARQILKASRAHIKNKRWYDDPNVQWTDEDDDYFTPVDTLEIDKIEIINEDPDPFYLATYLYIPDYDLHKLEWFVCDPFGIGSSITLQEAIENQCKNDKALDNFLEKFFFAVFGEPKLNDYSDTFRILTDLAEKELTNQLPEIVQIYNYYDQLLQMERSYQELNLFSTYVPQDKLDNVVILAGKVVEGMFRHIQEKFPGTSGWQIYDTPDRFHRHALIDEIASSLGYETPVPSGIANVNPRMVRKVFEHGGGTLNERIIVSLLVARLETNHPIRRVSHAIPDLFKRLSALARARGISAHENPTDTLMEDIETQRNHVYQILRAFLEAEEYSGGNDGQEK